MDSLSTREYDPYQDLNETEKEAMRRCVSYWNGRSAQSDGAAGTAGAARV